MMSSSRGGHEGGGSHRGGRGRRRNKHSKAQHSNPAPAELPPPPPPPAPKSPLPIPCYRFAPPAPSSSSSSARSQRSILPIVPHAKSISGESIGLLIDLCGYNNNGRLIEYRDEWTHWNQHSTSTWFTTLQAILNTTGTTGSIKNVEWDVVLTMLVIDYAVPRIGFYYTPSLPQSGGQAAFHHNSRLGNHPLAHRVMGE